MTCLVRLFQVDDICQKLLVKLEQEVIALLSIASTRIFHLVDRNGLHRIISPFPEVPCESTVESLLLERFPPHLLPSLLGKEPTNSTTWAPCYEHCQGRNTCMSKQCRRARLMKHFARLSVISPDFQIVANTQKYRFGSYGLNLVRQIYRNSLVREAILPNLFWLSVHTLQLTLPLQKFEPNLLPNNLHTLHLTVFKRQDIELPAQLQVAKLYFCTPQEPRPPGESVDNFCARVNKRLVIPSGLHTLSLKNTTSLTACYVSFEPNSVLTHLTLKSVNLDVETLFKHAFLFLQKLTFIPLKWREINKVDLSAMTSLTTLKIFHSMFIGDIIYPRQLINLHLFVEGSDSNIPNRIPQSCPTLTNPCPTLTNLSIEVFEHNSCMIFSRIICDSSNLEKLIPTSVQLFRLDRRLLFALDMQTDKKILRPNLIRLSTYQTQDFLGFASCFDFSSIKCVEFRNLIPNPTSKQDVEECRKVCPKAKFLFFTLTESLQSIERVFE